MKRVAIVILVFVIALGLVFLFLASPKGNETLGELAKPALDRNQQNTLRKNDAAKLAGVLATYISQHQSSFPQTTSAVNATTIAVCGADCTEANKLTVSLDIYPNTTERVSFRQYNADLVVPDLQTMYIIPNANCKDDKTGVGISTVGQKYLSIVVLYAIQEDSNVKQQCLSPY